MLKVILSAAFLFLPSVALHASDADSRISDVAKNPEVLSAIRQTREELRDLYAQLNRFRNDPEFRSVGFSQCCQYYSWLQKASRLGANANRGIQWELAAQFGRAKQSLMEVAHIYRTGSGSDPQDLARGKAAIEKALSTDD